MISSGNRKPRKVHQMFSSWKKIPSHTKWSDQGEKTHKHTYLHITHAHTRTTAGMKGPANWTKDVRRDHHKNTCIVHSNWNPVKNLRTSSKYRQFIDLNHKVESEAKQQHRWYFYSLLEAMLIVNHNFLNNNFVCEPKICWLSLCFVLCSVEIFRLIFRRNSSNSQWFYRSPWITWTLLR